MEPTWKNFLRLRQFYESHDLTDLSDLAHNIESFEVSHNLEGKRRDVQKEVTFHSNFPFSQSF